MSEPTDNKEVASGLFRTPTHNAENPIVVIGANKPTHRAVGSQEPEADNKRSLTPAEDSLIVACIAGSESAAQQVVKLLADSAYWKQEAKRWEELTNAAEAQRDAAVVALREIQQRLWNQGKQNTIQEIARAAIAAATSNEN